MNFDKKIIKKLQNNIPVTILSNFKFNIPDNCKGIVRFNDEEFKAIYLVGLDIKSDITKSKTAILKFDQEFKLKYIYLNSDTEENVEYRYDLDMNIQSKYLKNSSYENGMFYTKIEENGKKVKDNYVLNDGEFLDCTKFLDFLEKEKIIVNRENLNKCFTFTKKIDYNCLYIPIVPGGNNCE